MTNKTKLVAGCVLVAATIFGTECSAAPQAVTPTSSHTTAVHKTVATTQKTASHKPVTHKAACSTHSAVKHAPTAPVKKPAAAAVSFPQGKWLGVTEGLAIAKKVHKPVLVDVYTDWCGWCHRMEETTFRDEKVLQTMNPNFVLVRANAEDGADGEAFAKKANVDGYPTFLLLDSSGATKKTISGYRNADEFLPILNQFLHGG